ncbi:MAG: AsmA family protein, partial [Planctomycetota bacterium]
MPRPRFTVGRAFALLILGIAIGIALYVSRHLRPESIKEQFVAELERVCANRVVARDIRLALDTGVEVVDLKIYYPGNKVPAIEAERVAIMVDHKELLSGEIHVRQVDVYGLVVRLRYEDADGLVPGLPGVFREQKRARGAELPEGFPLVRVLPGQSGSRLELLNPRTLRKGTQIRMDCLHAEARPDASHYRLTAKLAGGDRIDSVTLNLALDPADRTIDMDTEIRNLKWEREDVERLSPWARERLPPVEFGGAADVTARARVNLDGFTLADFDGRAELRDLVGVFGNIYTRERKGLPFALRDGSGQLRFNNGRFVLSDFDATYVSPSGVTGGLRVGMFLDLARAGHHLDLSLEARALQTSTEDLRNLLPPEIRENIVEQFRPAGTFDFNVTISQRPSLPEKVVADLKFWNGEIDYAGRLDELTGKRFGFRYPLDRCSGQIHIETNVPTAHGFADVIDVKGIRGYSRIDRSREGDPENVEVEAEGRVVAYGQSGEDGVYREDVDLAIHVRDLPIDAKLAA